MKMSLVGRLVACAFAFVGPSVPIASPKEGGTFAEIRRTLELRYPKLKIVDVQPAPISSLFEVFTGKEILYTDKSAEYLISGSIVDTRTKRDLTENRLNERNAISFGSLPFEQAIKIVKGSGQRKLAVFSDPDCPYCRRLEQQLKDVTDLTVYIFLFPLTDIHPNALQHSKDIWCAGDRAQAWSEWMLENREPNRSTCESDPVSALAMLGDKLNVSATPTLYFENGQRVVGGLNTADLESRFAEAKRASIR